MSKILVTGGLGYIGSHVVVELQNEGFEVIIIDNLLNSSESVIKNIYEITGLKPDFEKIDLRNKSHLTSFFKKNTGIDGVIHFAASKSVAESVANPLMYYENNLNSLVHLLEGMRTLKLPKLIFSSSCTVYGEPEKLPVSEESPIKKAESPYGTTKKIGEQIIDDFCYHNSSFKSISLRYFNPIGAHSSVKIGELPITPPQNLVPIITQTAIGKRDKLSIYGNDYNTKDGTCIRDYIHVVDLAKAHVISLKRLLEKKNSDNYEVFNIGTGKGTSVLELVNTFQKVTGVEFNYCFAPRRPGDITSAYADTKKANEILMWNAELTIEDALLSAWKWEKILKIN